MPFKGHPVIRYEQAECLKKKSAFPFLLGSFYSSTVPPLNPFLLISLILLEQTSMEKGFQRGIQACFEKGHGHMSRDAGLQGPLPTIRSFVVAGLWADTRLSECGCKNASLSVSCRMKPQNDNIGRCFVWKPCAQMGRHEYLTADNCVCGAYL